MSATIGKYYRRGRACGRADADEIAENDFNLAARCYKPPVAAKPPEEDPAELITKSLQIERNIAAGLEKLRKQVEAS